MDFEFDKEMDIWLRNSAQQDDFASENTDAEHLDADDLAAFAENALPASARIYFVEHLSNCTNCRAILSSLILLQEAEEGEPLIMVAEKAPPKRFWFEAWQSVFAWPKLGLAAASLSVLLVAAVAFVVLQNTKNREMAQVSQTEVQLPAPAAKNRAAVPVQNQSREEEVDVTPLPEDLAAKANVEQFAESSTPPAEINEADLPPSVRATRGLSGNKNTPPQETGTKQTNSNAPISDGTFAGKDESRRPVVGSPVTTEATIAPKVEQKSPNKDKTQDRERKEDSAEMGDDIAEKVPSPAGQLARSSTDDSTVAKRVDATKNVGGKTFRRVGGVWIDSAYNSQNARTVARGSDEYKKLDASLRSIVERLSGEIVVAWQSKAYRIR